MYAERRKGVLQMQYVYAVMWFVMAFFMIFRFGKENKIFYLAGGVLVVFGVWWLLDAIRPEWQMFGGTPGIVFRVVIVAALVAILLFYLKQRKNREES